MRLRWKVYFLFTALGFNPAFGQRLDFHGQAATWLIGNFGNALQTAAGLRYLPDLVFTPSTGKVSIDAEITLNLYQAYQFRPDQRTVSAGQTRLYRGWLRVSSAQFEARLGLQKINFGTASMFRPLMWFDRIDPRDPLQITTGVYGLLLRYYFMNNRNLWGWGLYGNDSPKGWERLPTKSHSIEFGGRFQTPLFKGEIGGTYHYRRIDWRQAVGLADNAHAYPEQRLGLDGKWDLGCGVWFEGVLVHQEVPFTILIWQRLMTLGIDYTFGIGNGLNVQYEYFQFQTLDRPLAQGTGVSFHGLLLNYSLDLMDTLTGMFSYDLKNAEFYRFLNWQRRYDRWIFYVIGFWNPALVQLYQNNTPNSLFAGKGGQLMLVFNH